MKIVYDADKKNREEAIKEVYEQLKAIFPFTDIKVNQWNDIIFESAGQKVEFRIERKTRAGNQYLQTRIGWNTYKIPVNQEISKEKIISQINKMIGKERELNEERNRVQDERQRVYEVFTKNNSNPDLRLRYDCGKSCVEGKYSSSNKFYVSESSLEKDLNEINEYFRKYRAEKEQIEKLNALIKEEENRR